MGGIKVKIHPLFILFGLYYACTRKFLIFIVCTLTAIVHELGHSIVAEERGYKLNKITLMPFGAVVSGNFNQPNLKEDIIISLAGPMVNLLIALLFVAFWWVQPLSYPYTQLAVSTNLSMAIVNCFPAYPLDGGRVLSAYLTLKFNKRVADITCKTLGIIFSIILMGLFVWSIFTTINFSILFFALFIFFGVVGKQKENMYIKVFVGIPPGKLKLGVEIKRFAIDKGATIKRLVSILDYNAINEVEVLDGKKTLKTLSQEEIAEMAKENGYFKKIEDCLP